MVTQLRGYTFYGQPKENPLSERFWSQLNNSRHPGNVLLPDRYLCLMSAFWCADGSFFPLSAFYITVSISASPPCKVAAAQSTAHCLRTVTERFFHGAIIRLIVAPVFFRWHVCITCCQKSTTPLARTDRAMPSHLYSI